MSQGSHQQMMTHRFPLLKVKDIQVYMQELQCPMKEVDINEPKPEVMLRAYEYFLELFMGATREEFSLPSSKAIEMIEYKELHMESIGEASMMHAMIRLMFAVGIHDFSARDIIAPVKERVKLILSALINFAKFRQEHLDGFQEFCETSDELADIKVKEENRNRVLYDDIMRVREERAKEAPLVQKIDEEIIMLAAEVTALNKEQSNLRKEAESRKNAVQELRDNTNSAKLLLINRKQEVARLRTQIVQSPEKMKKAIDDLEKEVDAETRNVASTDKKLKEVQTKLDSIRRVDEDIKKLQETLEGCLAEYKKLVAMKKAVKDSDSKIEENNQQKNEYEQHIQHITRLIGAKNDQIAAQKQKKAAKLQSAQDALDALKHGKNSAENMFVQEDMRRNELQAKIQQVQDDIDELYQKNSSHTDILNGKLQDVQAELAIYKRTVLKSLTQLSQDTTRLNQEVK